MKREMSRTAAQKRKDASESMSALEAPPDADGMHGTVPRAERAYYVGIRSGSLGAEEAESLLSELAVLARTLGLEEAGRVLVNVRERNAALYMGSGKADEIVAAAKEAAADTILFDHPLSPIQQRNWEELAGLTVYDRHELILRIFAERARTREAALQVELARLQYSLPRLSHSYASLGRQRGGRYGTKGSGEQKIELDRRGISRRIAEIKDELEEVRRSRTTQKRRRERMDVPRAAIVGYTNAGKSSLLNAIALADVKAEDKLFATLDPTTRRLETPRASVLVTDTVGFIRNLPHGLVEAFKSTLEEAAESDLLVHVVDAADPEFERQHAVTCAVLAEIGAGERPSLVVFNKIDKLADRSAFADLSRRYPGAIFASAKTGEGLDALKDAIAAALTSAYAERRLRIPPDRYDLVALLHREAAVLSEDHDEEGFTVVRCALPDRLSERFGPYLA